MLDQACSEQTPVATQNEMYAAIELSGVSWLVAIHVPHADKISRHLWVLVTSGDGPPRAECQVGTGCGGGGPT